AWSQFASRLEDLAQPEKLESALSCLNLLVTDALRHVPDVIAYLSRLRNQSVFNFCAIPQGVVKIRKGQAVTLMMEATNMRAVQTIIAQYSQEVCRFSLFLCQLPPHLLAEPPFYLFVQILKKVSLTDPSRDKTLHILALIQEKSTLPQPGLSSRSHHLSPMYLSAAMLLAALSWQYLSTTAAQAQGTGDMQ
ncbi:hypothetical protein GOODEAATRI_016137, partial [Goodea atripinnis]